MKKKYGNTVIRRTERLVKGLYSPRIIDILLLFPEFEESVAIIRKRLNTTPESLTVELKNFIGKEKYSHYQKAEEILSNAYVKGMLDENGKFVQAHGLTWEEHEKLHKQIQEWEKQRFPMLVKYIGILRLKVFGKIPKSWTETIKDYVLYNQKTTFYPESQSDPEFNSKTDPITDERYIEIKVYGDSNLSMLSNKRLLTKLQKELPTYFKMDEYMGENLERRAIYYSLRKKRKVSPDIANRWLEYFNFEPIDYQHGHQELNERFANLFYSKNSPFYKKRVKIGKKNIRHT